MQMRDQRQYADQFADARRMQPDKRAVRPCSRGDAAPLADAFGNFASAFEPRIEQQDRERLGGSDGGPVDAQAERFAHEAEPGLSAIS